MYKDRKVYFAWLFSIFILFAVLILLRTPVYMVEGDRYIWLLTPTAITPAALLFMKNKGSLFNIKIVIAYSPAFTGFLMSVALNNGIYFLASFPVFLINFIVIFPKR